MGSLCPCWLDQTLALERTGELMLQEMMVPFMCACILSAESWPTLRLHGWQPASLFCLLVSLGKNTGVGCSFLLQGIFWTWDQTLVSYISCIGRRLLYHSALSLHCAAGCRSVLFAFSFWSFVSLGVFKKKEKKKKKNFIWKFKLLELDRRDSA